MEERLLAMDALEKSPSEEKTGAAVTGLGSPVIKRMPRLSEHQLG